MEEEKKIIENIDLNKEEQTHSKTLEIRTVEDVMEDSFLKYSMSVIIDRALPDVRDGLKPVHRRILFSMGEQGLNFLSQQKLLVTLWVNITHTATALFIILWCV